MDPILVSVLAATAATTASLAFLLAVTKFVHREMQRYRGVRTAYYTAAIGEMLSRRVLPSRPRQGWAEDPLFHEAIADYRLMVTGSDRRLVDEYIERLGIGDVLVRRAKRRFPRSSRLQAISSLVNLADSRHAAALQGLIDDTDAHVRINAVRGLSRIGDTAAIPHILDIATRVAQWEASRTADALVDMGEPAVEPVLRWVQHERAKERPSGFVIALCARLLGLIGDPVSEPLLIELLGTGNPEWRVAAASALEHVGTDDAVGPLRMAIHDDDWRVRARAVVALGAMADPTVLDEVAQLLTDSQWWVRQNAAGALSKLPGGLDRLFDAIDSPDAYAADAARSELTSTGALGRRGPLTTGA